MNSRGLIDYLGGLAGKLDLTVGTAGLPAAKPVRSQSHLLHSGLMLSSAPTHRSGGRMRLALRLSPLATSFMHLRSLRSHVLIRFSQMGLSSSSSDLTIGGSLGGLRPAAESNTRP